MTEAKILTDREMHIRAGRLVSTIFATGTAVLSMYGSGFTLDIHLTHDQAVQLSKDLEEIVAAYDATVDHYHDVCDEPVVDGVC